MSRNRLGIIGVALLATLSINALAASSALAAFTLPATEECTGTGIPTFCWENAANKKLFNLSGNNAMTGTLESGTENKLKSNLGEELVLKATGATLNGTLEQGPVLTTPAHIAHTTIKFTGVKITASAALAKKCAIEGETITTNAIKGYSRPQPLQKQNSNQKLAKHSRP